MVGDIDGVCPQLADAHGVVRADHSLDHQGALPALAKPLQELPVGAAPGGGAVVAAGRGPAVVGHARHAGTQGAKRPARMESEIEEVPGLPAQRRAKAVAQIARPLAQPRHIDRQHQRADARCLRPIAQRQGGFDRAGDIELEPGMTLGHLGQALQRRRTRCRDAQGKAPARRGAGQGGVGARPGEVAHPHRCAAKGQAQGLSKHVACQIRLAWIDQHTRHQGQVPKGGLIAMQSRLLAGGAIDEVEDQARQAAACRASPVGIQRQGVDGAGGRTHGWPSGRR